MDILNLPIFLVIVNAVFFVIVIFHTRKSDLAILCSGAVPTVGLGGNIGPVFNDVRLRSRMEATAKVQQIRFISASKEKRSSHDIEERSSSHENNSVPSSQEDNDVSSYQGSNVVSPLTGTDDHEMAVFMGAGFANQDNARRRSLGEGLRGSRREICLDILFDISKNLDSKKFIEGLSFVAFISIDLIIWFLIEKNNRKNRKRRGGIKIVATCQPRSSGWASPPGARGSEGEGGWLQGEKGEQGEQDGGVSEATMLKPIKPNL